MTNWIIDYAAQLTPILLGIMFLLAVKKIKMHGKGIRISSCSEVPEKGVCHDSGFLPVSENTEKRCGLHKKVFEKEVHDLLIQNGLFDRNAFDKEMHKLAFEKLGIIDERKLRYLNVYLKTRPCKKLRVYATDTRRLLNYLLCFEYDSGLLLSYLANYNIEFLGV